MSDPTRFRPDLRLSSAQFRENALRVSRIGQEILNDSIQKIVDSKTIVLKRKKKQ